MKTFPKNFWWGAATSGPQSEGRFNKKHANVFDYHYEIEPEKFHNQVGPDTASNFYNSYKEDIKMMRSIGMNSLRTSIQWSRLIDDLETNTVNQDAVDFYNNVIDTMIAEGMTPVMNLHHFDLPVELYDKFGGWESKKVVDLYVGFAEKCFELFGDRVKFWATHNEPMVVVEGEYLFQFHYPNIVNGKKAVQVAYNLNLASAKAIQAFRQLNISDAQIGTILNLTPTYAASEAPEDQEAARIAELWNNKMFLEPAVYGHFPAELEELLTKDKVLWETTDEEKAILKNNTVDFLGVNFYHPNRVKAPDVAPNSVGEWMPDRYYDAYDMPGRRVNLDRGWEIYPKALYDIAVNIKENYKNIPWYVSENGMGVSNEERFKNSEGMIEDDYRIDFVQEHLEWLHKGIEEGSNCFGYHMWTPIDCWSWLNAYKNRYGFISNNIHTQIKTIKKSGHWFKEVTERNGLED
ncbi:glycoside hydrolase family 1 protein [Enterococcus pseudoavium]|uniref:glycoside hydrolase family 1 protein n=1 Tax=Enterococcus pseudoavium TaxID=44007 RepID=UPI000E225490|nr:glycoside hydrolase family 1 protein [Enterococcus pseudoavium]MDT2754847.1 glycoside hydrolase family 1 protein [Enterococcus pseudoavium]REC33245.1 6-phospho-beta-glucosidase [Enterococcus pseudoavium]